MIVADRLLVALGQYVVSVGALDLDPRLRDWSGTQGAKELILDADDPEEHEAMRGVYAIDGTVVLRVHARDEPDEERREVLGSVRDVLADETALKTWLNDSSNDRGIGTEGLHVYELRCDDGVWEWDDDRINGKVEFAALAMGKNVG